MEFVAVHQFRMSTLQEARVDHQFPKMWLVLGKNQAPPHIEAPGNLFKMAFHR